MHRILSFFLGLHWMVHFSLLAIWSAGASGGALPSAYGWLGTGGPAVIDGGLAIGMSLGFGIAAVLFLWMLVAVMFDRRSPPGDADDVGRMAFAASTGVLTLVLVAGATQPATGLMPAVSLQLGALLVSYVAVSAERRSFAEHAKSDDDAGTGASVMALGAAHNAMLSRLSGRTGVEGPV